MLRKRKTSAWGSRGGQSLSSTEREGSGVWEPEAQGLPLHCPAPACFFPGREDWDGNAALGPSRLELCHRMMCSLLSKVFCAIQFHLLSPGAGDA